jgi:hypothetical protein
MSKPLAAVDRLPYPGVLKKAVYGFGIDGLMYSIGLDQPVSAFSA